MIGDSTTMSTSTDEGPTFAAVRLWERPSRNGGTFMSGVWGGARVLIVRNADRTDEDDADWVLLLGPNHHSQPRKPRRTP